MRKRRQEAAEPPAEPGAAAIAELDLPVRIVNQLESRKCLWLPDLFAHFPDEAASWPGCCNIRKLVVAAMREKGMPVPYHWDTPQKVSKSKTADPFN